MEQIIIQLQLMQRQVMSNDKIRSQAGFSLMDLVIGITFLSFAFLATMRIANDLQQKLDNRDLQIRATSLANSMMSIVRSVDFDENTATPWTIANNLGMDASGLYDDVDDFIFNPAVPANFGLAGVGYTIIVAVIYVDPTTSPPNMTIPLTGTNSSNFKRVTVSITHPDLSIPIQLSAIITPNVF